MRMYTARVNHPITIRKPRFTPNSGPCTAESTYVHIEKWRNRPLQGDYYPYVYVDGIYLRRNWGGEFENVESAVDKLVHVVETVEPDTELVEKYEKCYRKFKKYYPALKGLF